MKTSAAGRRLCFRLETGNKYDLSLLHWVSPLKLPLLLPQAAVRELSEGSKECLKSPAVCTAVTLPSLVSLIPVWWGEKKATKISSRQTEAAVILTLFSPCRVTPNAAATCSCCGFWRRLYCAHTNTPRFSTSVLAKSAWCKPNTRWIICKWGWSYRFH